MGSTISACTRPMPPPEDDPDSTRPRGRSSTETSPERHDANHHKKLSGLRRSWITILSLKSSLLRRKNTVATILEGEDRVRRDTSPEGSGTSSGRTSSRADGHETEWEIPVSSTQNTLVAVYWLFHYYNQKPVPGFLSGNPSLPVPAHDRVFSSTLTISHSAQNYSRHLLHRCLPHQSPFHVR